MHVLLDNTQSSDEVIINSVVSALCRTLNDAAKNTFGTVIVNKPRNRKRSNVTKWFNIECQNARNHFHVQKRIFSKNKTSQNKTNMTAAVSDKGRTIEMLYPVQACRILV